MGSPTRSREESAVIAARMYYLAGHNSNEIARYLSVSRSTVSRLLTYARESGIVEIRVQSELPSPSALQSGLREHFPSTSFHIVEVRSSFTQARVADSVAQYAAHLIVDFVQPGCTVGLAWGNTISTMIGHVRTHPVPDVRVVQLNGAGNHGGLGIKYSADIVARFAEKFGATDHLFPVPAFFDHAVTKRALWRERSIKQILDIQADADVLVFSIGSLVGDPSSYVYAASYLTKQEVAELRGHGVIGDIATVFFTESGSTDLEINERSSGPPLSLYRNAERAVCIASGANKVPGVIAALGAGYITDLIIDMPTATELLRCVRLAGLMPRVPNPVPQSGRVR